MAGEIGHVVYAARVLTYLDDSVSDPSYWAGTLFPDIRHLGVVSRHRTHPEGVTLTSLVGKSDFRTGMRVHAWVDSIREQFLRKQHIKESLPWHPFVPHALKLVEDEWMYDYFDDWNLIKRVLNQIYDEEVDFIHDQEKIQSWHRLLQDYFRYKPGDEARYDLTLAIGLSEKVADEMNTVVARLKESRKTREVIELFWQHLEDIFR